MPNPRMTLPTQAVLRTLVQHPSHEFYGLELCAAAGLASGTIHPILARLENLGWLTSRWEDLDPHEAGRPRRRYYSLTSDGAVQARRALAGVDARTAKLGALRPGFSGGAS
ncbi:PadR family transcriptional regulator [Plantactinospora sp. CA-290183]|uniref:PadR family transcriptional regulator n=1 Tax=Plantactinospora sp. CA-290183 TaxID=3240006 RepID=UPI003D8FA0CE